MSTTKKIYTLKEIEEPENFSYLNPVFNRKTEFYYLENKEKIFITVLDYSKSYHLSGFGNPAKVGNLCFTLSNETGATVKQLYLKGVMQRDIKNAGKSIKESY